MRDIKFRGLSDNSDGTTSFVYGMLSHDLPGSTGYYGTHSYRICWNTEDGGRASKPVRNGTIGQFTGLLDKNDSEIYEGDVVVYRDISGSGRTREFGPRQVRWYQDSCNFNVSRPSNGAEIEVIGNIHENPELLEQDARQARNGRE